MKNTENANQHSTQEKTKIEEYNEIKGSGNSQGGDTYNFYNVKPDPYEYARQMKRAKKELEFEG